MSRYLPGRADQHNRLHLHPRKEQQEIRLSGVTAETIQMSNLQSFLAFYRSWRGKRILPFQFQIFLFAHLSIVVKEIRPVDEKRFQMRLIMVGQLKAIVLPKLVWLVGKDKFGLPVNCDFYFLPCFK